jgi:hypothetical protein
MKISKIAASVLLLFLACSLFGLALAGWRTVDYAFRMQLPLHALWFGVKAVCFMGIATVGFCLLRLTRQYTRLGFFNDRSTSTVRLIGLVTVGVAFANSLFHVLTYQVISVHATALPTLKSIVSNWLTDLLYESPILFFFSLLVFLFASFMGKAIAVKHEAEAFI